MTATEPVSMRERLRSGQFSFSTTGTSPDWWLKTAAHWRNVCRNHAFQKNQVKVAELGGGQDTPFEQAFSNLAHAYLKDKAPKLLDYEVGFQLLEKNQENTKAVGVFGFKVGSQWIYCPVFFLNGDLKGHELMYIKSQDMFVPLKEEWIDYILGKKPAVLGDGVNRNLSLLGIMPPNLYQLSRSPQKFASHLPPGVVVDKGTHLEDDSGQSGEGTVVERHSHTDPDPTKPDTGVKVMKSTSTTGQPKMASWARDFMPNLAYLATTPVNYDGVRGVPDLLKEAGEPLFRFLVEKVGTTYPTLFQEIDKLYGPEMLTDVARHIYAQKKAAASTSLVKGGATTAYGDKPPADWDGTMQRPSKLNGGVRSDGEEAWDLSQVGRRRTGAHIGHLGDSAKMAHYPGCRDGRGPKGPNKMKCPKCGMVNCQCPHMRKRASIIPSAIGPTEALPNGLKHKVINREMVDVDPQLVHGMSSDERQTLLKERVVFKDNRDDKEVTIAYNVQTPLRMQNPDHTGIYYVLVKPDRFEKCLVVMHPHNHKQKLGLCTVVRLDGTKNYVNTHPANVWHRSEVDNDTWKKWLDKLETANSIPLQRRDKKYGGPDYKDKRCFLLLGPSGQGTVPFKAREEYTGGDDEQVVYDVRFEDHEWSRRPAYLPDHGRGMKDYGMCSPCDSYGEGEHLVLTKRPGIKLMVKPGYLMVPDQFKIMQCRDEDSPEETYMEPLQLGTLADVQTTIMNYTEPLRVVSDGKDVTVEENRMDKLSAVMHLFYDHGLRKEAAEEIVDRAIKHGKCEPRLLYSPYIKACWDLTEKQAIDPGNDMIRGAPNAPPFPEPYMGYDPLTGGNIPTMQESEFNVKIPDMSASKTDRSIYYPFGPDPKAMQVAQDAGRTGQKEVFDTAMLGSLLKVLRQDNMVDRYMGDLMKGMDRLGRILFLYYWHGEEFEDRYGKQDMPELEDGLRNAFEGVGDIILVLKRKAIEPQLSDDDGKVDLGPIANQ